MKIIEGGVTAAKGFEAASTAAKIKYQDRTDMAMIYSQVPCECAGTFTTNVVKAACVKWDQQVVKSGAKAQAVIVNSGIANACTGEEGMGYCKETAEAAAKAEEEKAAAEAAAKAEEEKKVARLVKVKVKRRFRDMELNQIKDAGDAYTVSRERAAVLEEAGVAAVIEE